MFEHFREVPSLKPTERLAKSRASLGSLRRSGVLGLRVVQGFRMFQEPLELEGLMMLGDII